MKEKQYLLEYSIFALRFVFFPEDNSGNGSFIFYNANNGEWSERLESLSQNWRFQDPKTQFYWEDFLKDVNEFLSDFPDWTDDMEIGESILTYYGHVITCEA